MFSRKMRLLIIIIVFVSLVTEHQMKAPPARIIGGDSVDINQYPYQVSVQLYSNHVCGGVIISEIWVLTAYHCLIKVQKISHLSIRVGSTYHNGGGKVYSIEKLIRHPSYYDYDNDIALLKMKKAIRIKNAKPIGLPSHGSGPKIDSIGVVTGWGSTVSGGKLSKRLQMVQIPIASQEKCENSYEFFRIIITDTMFCAGWEDGRRDSCRGDSGGPLVIDGKLYGIVSFGRGCANALFPGVYANIPALRLWIKDETGV